MLTDPLDPPAFAKAMADLLADTELRARFRATGIERARAAGWDRYAATSVRLVRDLSRTLAKRASPRRLAAPHRMIVCDIDNTLTGRRDGARAFAEWRGDAADVHFAVATGRSLPEARAVLSDWGLPEPDTFVTSVGTEIYRRDAGGALGFDAA